MKFRNAILICCLCVATTNLFAEVSNYTPILPETNQVTDSSNYISVLDVVNVTDIGNCSNLLEWLIPADKKYYSFVIMKSMDKEEFTSIGSVIAKSSSQQQQYEFVDTHAASGEHYRIDLFDFKGAVVSSEILMSTSSCGSEKATTTIEEVYPDDLHDDELVIRVYQNKTSTEKVQLTDQYGKVMIEKDIKLAPGKNNLHLNVKHIARGTYVIKIGATSKKFVR